MEQKMPWKRLRHYLILVCMTVLTSLFFAKQNGLMLDGFFAYLLVDAVFLAVLFYMLESSRIHQELGQSTSCNFGKIAKYYTLFCLILAVFRFLPAFTCPAAAFALFFSLVSNTEIAASLSVFLCILLGMADGGGFYELASCCLLIFIGMQASKTMQERKLRIWGCILLFFSSLCIPSLFYYFANSTASRQLFIWNASISAVTVACFAILADKLYDSKIHEEPDAYEYIVKEDYPLVVDIKNYSKAEYVHAIKVATIARKCAAEIGADEMAAATAGFYYRLGILEGEPFVENGVKLAVENCFPAAVIQILSEYNGEERLPSSKESAIVHMADSCVKRIEMLSAQRLSSSWNQDMVIYQTLNELSASGIYDSSGVSMNQFLKVRELLVREEIGYDNNSGRRDGNSV